MNLFELMLIAELLLNTTDDNVENVDRTADYMILYSGHELINCIIN